MRHRIHTSAIVLRADPELVGMAAEKARQSGVSLSELVRDALRALLIGEVKPHPHIDESVKDLNSLMFPDGDRCWDSMSPLQQAFCRLAGAIEVGRAPTALGKKWLANGQDYPAQKPSHAGHSSFSSP